MENDIMGIDLKQFKMKEICDSYYRLTSSIVKLIR